MLRSSTLRRTKGQRDVWGRRIFFSFLLRPIQRLWGWSEDDGEQTMTRERESNIMPVWTGERHENEGWPCGAT